ncbi:bifunctional (p)ppGpp synthetase/guanosine-3',5'-bis(diphosphate) 3'-pyrophosphohydrolase [bacterium]|jgi:GTP diphosphokinase / guanosine-3',5'-bis(diphosphate) 3'-diphosphatase|nr:bifunctional (p)ppGpp synthetase/guanosine-3',5'-bis(diphosphate) 3'-pyrophosphohydrolase [bacterium]MBT4250857.1 bifunctional (p)ppGpp synthetase/guanosine-3',5'-bis(diphosphate) 3'-pyrophosphohydrolase [bacterium]MBT4597570.1 bifunctional (p)ppGpp synthetase/guanosine-3',5'-bis(diphosphate) 3'-pyrophosphohydrolase [bacterium]MBT6754035.1 bifunctional (p)ppGpp synthetase/guanosine-3',5'-bis(diphosphate) 3'-pyrophosphohydrolase [bacterium]MBT7038065.1 bifunctional (p)ppGpp synthetase/guanosi
MSEVIQPKTLKELISLRKIPYSSKRIERISKAYAMAKKAHQGQKRKSGEDYFVHCVETAATLVKMGLGSITISAALLHDVPEDTEIKLEEIEKEFGKEVAFIVEGVTKLGHVRLKGSIEEYYLDNLRKMFMAMAADIRVILIKLADRLHNMRTLEALPENKRFRIAKETMEIFVPIANRFGIGEVKGELEDLAFKYIEPEKYKHIVELETEAYKLRSQYVKSAIRELKEELKTSGIKLIDVHGRAKRYFRLYKKLEKYDMNVDKVYDLVAIRLVVTTVASCYETLGIVHKKYKPLIGRIKDYISLPKPNGYKSIHTTVFGPEGKILEIQIRTERMHDEAEFGIAAHWIYTQGRTWKDIMFRREPRAAEVPEKELEWVQQLKQWHTETGGQTDEFWRSIKIDFFKNHIFAFTPSGDVIELPEGATPIDFAYRIHSEVGDRAMGAKANGKMVSLDYIIHNGDLIDVVTSKDKKLPSRDWLRFVKTAHAQAKIKNTLRKGGVRVVGSK